tara:strand:- start:626 stop:976 length:351 start_codon:yes stop_codon:yes gene_type:complete
MKIISIIAILLFNQSYSENLLSYNLIRKICTANVEQEIGKAKTETEEKNIKEICDCFFDKLKGGKSISMAKESCKEIYDKEINESRVISLNGNLKIDIIKHSTLKSKSIKLRDRRL